MFCLNRECGDDSNFVGKFLSLNHRIKNEDDFYGAFLPCVDLSINSFMRKCEVWRNAQDFLWIKEKVDFFIVNSMFVEKLVRIILFQIHFMLRT